MNHRFLQKAGKFVTSCLSVSLWMGMFVREIASPGVIEYGTCHIVRRVVFSVSKSHFCFNRPYCYLLYTHFIPRSVTICCSYILCLLQGVQLNSGPILIWVIYLLRFTTYYITQLTCIYSKFWKWCPFISMHLSTRFTMFLATFLSVLSFFNHFRNSTFYWRLPSKFFKKKTLSTVGVRHCF